MSVSSRLELLRERPFQIERDDHARARDRYRLIGQVRVFQDLHWPRRDRHKDVRYDFPGRHQARHAIGAFVLPLIPHVAGLSKRRAKLVVHENSHRPSVSHVDQ
jgi:hypothetical protein